MKKVKIAVIIIFLLFAYKKEAQALEVYTEAIGEWAEFFAGVAAGAITHEAGHQVMATAHGVKLSWSREGSQIYWNYSPKNTPHLRNIAMGGFMAEIISTEILLYSGPPKRSFVYGWLMWNIVSSLAYIAVDLMSNERDGFGDYRDIRRNETGIKVEWVMAAKLVHAIWTAYRMYNPTPALGRQRSNFQYFFAPTGEAVIAGFAYRF